MTNANTGNEGSARAGSMGTGRILLGTALATVASYHMATVPPELAATLADPAVHAANLADVARGLPVLGGRLGLLVFVPMTVIASVLFAVDLTQRWGRAWLRER